MATGYCIVCERTGTWGRVLARSLSRDRAVVLQTRSFEQCEEQVAARPASIILLVGNDFSVLRLFDFVCRVSVRRERVKTILVAPRRWEDGFWWMREAGVAHVVSSLGQLPAVCRLISRYLSSLPPVEMTIADRVTLKLPWARLSKRNV